MSVIEPNLNCPNCGANAIPGNPNCPRCGQTMVRVPPSFESNYPRAPLNEKKRRELAETTNQQRVIGTIALASTPILFTFYLIFIGSRLYLSDLILPAIGLLVVLFLIFLIWRKR